MLYTALMAIDHISLRVKDYQKSKSFYAKVLKPLGYEILMEFEGGAGMGAEGKPDFWLGGPMEGGQPHAATHIAFRAPDRKAVDEFYKAAMAAGAKDNGGPGLRKEYHEHYYGAFVIDFDGHNIEAVTHRPE